LGGHVGQGVASVEEGASTEQEQIVALVTECKVGRARANLEMLTAPNGGVSPNEGAYSMAPALASHAV